MTLHADLFFSFRSPYSYLAIGRYRAMAEEWGIDIALRPVYPLAIREPDFSSGTIPNWLRYTFTDMMRVAQYHGIAFGPPVPIRSYRTL
jgi:2-hydroxychromene-2-carboxylate isomerase